MENNKAPKHGATFTQDANGNQAKGGYTTLVVQTTNLYSLPEVPGKTLTLEIGGRRFKLSAERVSAAPDENLPVLGNRVRDSVSGLTQQEEQAVFDDLGGGGYGIER